MDYIKGTDREQIILFSEAIDGYIEPDNPVLFIDAFVENTIEADRVRLETVGHRREVYRKKK